VAAQVQVAVSAFDDRALEQVYGPDFSSYPLSVVFQDILMPLWLQMLQRQDAFGQTSEWLFFDGFLRRGSCSALSCCAARNRAR
jgi:hypothetical protein